jgi:hypothetical protein
MKPSVHLQHVATGRRWVGRCTGEPQPGNFIRFGCGDFWVGSNPGSDILLDPPSVCPRHAIVRVIDTRLHFLRDGTQVNDCRVGPNWIEVHPPGVLTFGSEVGLRILWVGEGLSPFTPALLAWNGGTAVKMARAIVDGARFSDLPILADALEEAGCTCAAALACLRKGERSVTADYLLELLLGRLPPATVIDSRPVAQLKWDRNMPDPRANDNLFREGFFSLPLPVRQRLYRILELLRLGHTHEEIGVMLGMNPEFIRRFVQKLREKHQIGKDDPA